MHALVLGVRHSEEGNWTKKKDFIRKSLLGIEWLFYAHAFLQTSRIHTSSFYLLSLCKGIWKIDK